MQGPAYWTYGLPVALTAKFKALIDRLPLREVRGPLYLLMTAGVGAVGEWLVRNLKGGLRRRLIVWPAAWALCALGYVWLLIAAWPLGGYPFLFVVPPALVGLLRLAFVHGAPTAWQHRGFRLATGYVAGRGRRLLCADVKPGCFGPPSRVLGYVVLCCSSVWFVCGGWLALFGIPAFRYATIGLPIAALDGIERFLRRVAGSANIRRRFLFATGRVGARGLALYRSTSGSWSRRIRAWFLCLAGLVWFILIGWTAFLATRRGAYAVFCLPIALVHLIEWVFRQLAGPDWHKAGLYIATACLGPAALWLYRKPRRWWLRAPAWAAAMLLSIAGLAWFAYGGKWALLLVPFLRQGKRLRAAPLYPPEPEWADRPLSVRLERFDYLSLGIIAALGVLLWIGHRGLKPFAPDAYYHLLVAQRIVETGRVPLWDWWQFAPLGRPHLYPPLLHMLIALLSVPYSKDVIEGLRLLQVFILPAGYLSTWYFARWLFDDKRAFLTVLILGADIMFPLLGLMALPSILANCLLPVVFVMFLSKRFWGAAGLIGVTLYTHMGVAPLALLSLFIFSVWNRKYLAFFFGTALTGIVFAMPWYAHVWMNRAWLGHPMRGQMTGLAAVLFKLFWLLMVNVIILLLAIRGAGLINWREKRNRLLLSNLLGFVPMLVSYGGRFFGHTAQIWAMLAAAPLAPLLTGRYRRQAVAVLLLLALCPTLLLGGMGSGFVPRVHPMATGWTFAPFVAFVGLGDGGASATPEILELAEYIKRTSTPDQILHVFDDASLGVMLSLHAQRRIDTGAWPEVRPIALDQLAEYTETDPTGYYLSKDETKIPEDTWRTQIGPFFIGVRGRGARDAQGETTDSAQEKDAMDNMDNMEKQNHGGSSS